MRTYVPRFSGCVSQVSRRVSTPAPSASSIAARARFAALTEIHPVSSSMTESGIPATDMSARTAESSFTERSRSRYGLRRLARSSSFPPTRATGIVLGGVRGSFICELIAFTRAYRNVSRWWHVRMWGLGGDFVTFPQRSRRQDAQHRDHYDVVTVLSEENCMGDQRTEQRKSRPAQNRLGERPENRACHGKEVEGGVVPDPSEGRKPQRDDGEKGLPRVGTRRPAVVQR